MDVSQNKNDKWHVGGYIIYHSYYENLTEESVARKSMLCIILEKFTVHHVKESEVAGHTVFTIKKERQVNAVALIPLFFIHSGQSTWNDVAHIKGMHSPIR